MQVNSVNFSQNNCSNKRNPNFTSIKSVKCEGLYKKYPELANSLVEAFKENPKAMEFCKKYDVDVVFYAVKRLQDSVKSSVHIFYDNIAKSKTRKFFDKLTGKSDDIVVVHAWGNQYSLPVSMEKSTKELVDAISPERKVGKSYIGGLLDSHLESADEKMQKVLNEKRQKVLEVEAGAVRAKASNAKKKAAEAELQTSIEELIKKGEKYND